MLADVMIEKERNKIIEKELQMQQANNPIEDDIVLYYSDLNKIGGIETWIYNLSTKYDFTLVYKTADEKQLERLKCKKIKYVGQKVKCNLMIYGAVYCYIPVEAERKVAFIHADYRKVGNYKKEVPDDVEIFAVSETAADGWESIGYERPKVMYNPMIIEEYSKPLILGVFSRLTKEKGRERINRLLDRLIEKNKQFLMLVFSDYEYTYNDERVIVLPPTLDVKGWMEKCDYIVQLSDTEAYAYTIVEALDLGKPIIVTDLPMLKEARIDSSIAKIIDFDMSNLDIDDLWNIPKVEYKPNQSEKEWDELMKKRVFREKYNKKEEIKKPVEAPKKNKKKKEE